LLAVAVAAAFWRSTEAVLPLVALDQPVGLTPAMPFLAVWVAISTTRARQRAGLPTVGQRESVVDAPVAVALLGAAAWLIWQAPQSQGWYFWSSRLDLLAAGLFALGLAVLFWGVQTLLWHKLTCLYVLLLWPEPLVRIQTLVAPPLATLTAVAVRQLAGTAHLALAPVGADPTVFASATEPGWVFVIGDACAGLNAALTVLLLAAPIALHLSLSRSRIISWLSAGVALAVLSNVVRILLVFIVAQAADPEFAMGVVHPVLGAILLVVVLGCWWWLALRWGPRFAAPSLPIPASTGHWLRSSAPALVAAVALSLVFAVGSAGLGTFEPLAPIGPPGQVLSDPLDYVQLPAGWEVRGRSAMAWKDLFGLQSTSYAMSFKSADGAIVKAQYVATPDQARLQAYSLEACRVYHGDDVVAQRTVDLGSGGVASLIDTIDQSPFSAGGRMSVLYWEAPFLLEGRTMHARLALFVVESDAGVLPDVAQAGVAPGGPAFDAADTVLVTLARGMAGELLGIASASIPTTEAPA